MAKKVGILMPIFSLPNKYGIGTLGNNAYKFIDFLTKAKQDYWQVLPSNPTSYGDSPYQSFSSFAQNPYFIDLELLVKDNLLSSDDLKNSYLHNNTNYIDYGNIFVNKMSLLKKAYFNRDKFNNSFKYFKKQNSSWLYDYAMFMALKEKNNYKCWSELDNKYKFRDKNALNSFYKENKDLVESYMFMQFLYARQYKNLLKYAHSKNIKIIGDMPIYVAYDSVDVWVNPSLFKLNENLNPTVVSGVPPDYFSSTGQLWGNPIYDYDAMEKDDYSWWVNRIAFAFKQADLVRIDHFRGFSAYYTIPYGNANAINGCWEQGPKMKLFDQISKKLNNPNIIAENLGLLDDDVNNLIKQTNYPGMRILEFEMYSKENIKKLLESSPNNIVYPGTHDNNTFAGWYFEDASQEERNNVIEQLHLKNDKSLSNQLIKYCYKFPFNIAIISMQDILGLRSNARLNLPGSDKGNWQYMFDNSAFNYKLANKLAKYKNKYVK